MSALYQPSNTKPVFRKEKKGNLFGSAIRKAFKSSNKEMESEKRCLLAVNKVLTRV